MMNATTLKALEMSGNRGAVSLRDVVAEAARVRAFVEAHKAKVDAAGEAFDDAREACLPVVNFSYTVTEKDFWRYPSVEAAHIVYRTLCDDDTYYWACSRLQTLELRLGEYSNKQTNFGF